MINTLSYLLIIVLVCSMSGCKDPGGKIVIDMDWTEAQKALDASGAKKTQLDVKQTAPSDVSGTEFYELKNGNLLMTAYARTSVSEAFRVSGLQLCSNPQAAKDDRKWESVREVTL